jgi:hypothetical protein
MARFKGYDFNQDKFLPINFSQQILPGSFENTVHYLVDNELDLSVLDSRYRNFLKEIRTIFAEWFVGCDSIDR